MASQGDEPESESGACFCLRVCCRCRFIHANAAARTISTWKHIAGSTNRADAWWEAPDVDSISLGARENARAKRQWRNESGYALLFFLPAFLATFLPAAGAAGFDVAAYGLNAS